MADFYANVRCGRTVKLGRSYHTRTDQRCCSIDTGFGLVVVFPALVVGDHGVFCTRLDSTIKGANRWIVLVSGTRLVFAFGVCCTVVRVSIIFIADTQNVGHIPRVYAQEVVQLVDTQLEHFVGLPVRGSQVRKRKILFLNILCYVSISQNFEDVTRLVTVVNPGLVRLH